MLNCSVNDIVKLNTHHQNMEPIVLWKESFCELLIYIFTALYFISSMTNCDFLGLKSVISNWQISDVWFTAQLKLDQKQICLWVQTFLWNATSWSKPEVFNTPVSCLRCPWRSFMIETWKLLLFWHCSLPKSSIHTNEISMEIRKEISIKWCRAAAGNSCQVWSWSLLSNRALNGGEWHTVWMVDVCEQIKLKVLLDSDVLFAGSPRLRLPQRNVWTARETSTSENDGDASFEDD